MELHDRIEEKLKENNTNASRVATKIGISKPAMLGYVKGKSIPTAIVLGKIARELNCTTDYLILGKIELDEIQDKGLNKIVETYNKLNEKNKLYAIDDLQTLLRRQKIDENF